METVREQLVKKPYKSTDKAKQYFILTAALFLAMVAMIISFSVLGGPFIIAGLLLGVLIVWGGYILAGKLNIEYEYCIAGSEMSVDKIIDQKKRKTLCSINLKEAAGFYRGMKELSDATIISSEGDGEVYTIEYNDQKYGRTLLYFTPDERTLEMISPYLPRLI